VLINSNLHVYADLITMRKFTPDFSSRIISLVRKSIHHMVPANIYRFISWAPTSRDPHCLERTFPRVICSL